MRQEQRDFGQSLIEFALLLPVLLVLVIGLFDLGRAVFYFSVLNTAVREGTRVAIVQDFSEFEYYDVDGNKHSYKDEEIDLLIDTCSSANCQAHEDACIAITDKYFIGDLFDSIIIIDHKDTESENPRINIRIEFDYEPITPLIGSLIGNIPINVESEMLLAPVAQP